MANLKISQLTEDTAPSGDDLIVTVNDPAGTPVNRKVKILTLLKRLFLADATELAITTIADGEFLKRSGTNIVGAAAGGGGLGDVVGPVSATDNALVRFDSTTGKLIQNSTITVDDTGAITVPEMTAPSTPASGKVAVYAKADGKLYIKDDAGTESDLTGGGGSPGGSSTQVQYNNSGAFGGSSLFTFTNTGSGSTSSVLFPGGSSTVAGINVGGGAGFGVVTNGLGYIASSSYNILFHNGINLKSNGSFSISSGSDPGTTIDVVLRREAASTWGMVNGAGTAYIDLWLRACRHKDQTYANRPGSPQTGMVICVTDSTVNTFGATVAGGGSNIVLAWFNGTNWTVIGI